MELTITQAQKNPANFMYIWADKKEFLQKIDKKYANIIEGKKLNQIKLLKLSAEKYGKSYEEYTDAIREAFIATYDVTPFEALVILAQGGTIAGKNWSKGVYGIGAIYVNTFTNYPSITVRANDGHILNNGTDITDTSKTVYTQINKNAVEYQLFAEMDGVIFMSQYNKTKKSYYAQSYSTATGKYSARTGNEINASDNADLWGSIIEGIQIFITWLMSLFGDKNEERETINAENTLPNQKKDGFVQEAGFGGATTTLLLLVAGGALLAGGINPKTKK